MALLDLKDLHFGFDLPLLDGANLTLERGERIALVGRNGAGKTTFMRLLSGEYDGDHSLFHMAPGTRIAYLPQDVPTGWRGEVYDVVADGLGEVGDLVKEYHRLSAQLAEGMGDLDALEKVQHALEAQNGWLAHRRVESAVEQLGIPPETDVSSLSGGMARRVLLARALAAEPDILLLDEPTNHLDINAIEWLERLLKDFSGALLFVTHDRSFLDALATRIVELDRGKLTSWPGDWETYRRKRQERLEVEAAHAAEFDKKLAQEEAWIRQGIKARRTRNEGRVRALEKLRAERRARREVVGKARFGQWDAEISGKLVLEAKGVTFAYDDTEPLVKDFSTLVCRGDKIGILGPNGSGKTTLVRLLFGQLEPTEGTVRRGTKMEVAYFDQLRAQLDLDATVADNIYRGEYITIDGKKRHVISYLSGFLFTGEQCRGPVTNLSGGERNRLMLAKLFAQPSNILVLDEPTNDLDMETLELLEEILLDYKGTVLLVSHDRAFLDQVVTSTLVMEGDGRVGEFVGGYSDWLRQRPKPASENASAQEKGDKRRDAKRRDAKTGAAADRPRKLTYKENKELEALPPRIEALETEQASLHADLGDPDLYKSRGDEVAGIKQRLGEVEEELTTAYARWEELEALTG